MRMDGFRVRSSIHRKAFVVKRPDRYSTAWPFSKAFGRKWIKLLICGKCHSINICVLMQYSAISVDFSQWVLHFSATAGASGNCCHNSCASQIRAYVFSIAEWLACKMLSLLSLIEFHTVINSNEDRQEAMDDLALCGGKRWR